MVKLLFFESDGVREALVMAEIQVRFRPVFSHEDLSVLKGVHGPRVHIDIRIELLEGDLSPRDSGGRRWRRMPDPCRERILETLVSSEPRLKLEAQVLSLWEVSKEQLEHESDCLPRTRKLVVSLISWIGRMRLARDGDVEGVHQAFDLIARIGAETPIHWTILPPLPFRCSNT